MIIHIPSRCCKCLACIDECDNHALIIEDKGIYIDHDACIECLKCIVACPNMALVKEMKNAK